MPFFPSNTGNVTFAFERDGLRTNVFLFSTTSGQYRRATGESSREFIERMQRSSNEEADYRKKVSQGIAVTLNNISRNYGGDGWLTDPAFMRSVISTYTPRQLLTALIGENLEIADLHISPQSYRVVGRVAYQGHVARRVPRGQVGIVHVGLAHLIAYIIDQHSTHYAGWPRRPHMILGDNDRPQPDWYGNAVQGNIQYRALAND